MQMITIPVKRLFRLFRIYTVMARYGLDELIESTAFSLPLRGLLLLHPISWRRRKPMTPGEALRRALEDLGPIFIKFGQLLSTRPDILPLDTASELSKLQDNVPPFSSDIALKIIEKTYGRSAYEVFSFFDPISLASASMAQVHAATLITGESVVVKILRPNVRPIIEQDLDILRTFAKLATRYWSFGRRLKPLQVIDEFEQHLFSELDLREEAANGSQLRQNFRDDKLLYVPEIYWDYVHENILVVERINGIPITDIESLKAHGVPLKTLAERGVEIFFTQVFRDCFFHADMHPGNIFVSREHPANPQHICIDFGIMGSLTEHDQRYLAENLNAFFHRNYRRVAELHVESGWVSQNARIDAFERAIRMVCEPIFEKPLKDISFGQLMLRLFQVARRFDMTVQPQLVLLQKTLLAVEGLGRQLYPELDLWATAKPFLTKWLNRQIGFKAFFKQIKQDLPFIADQLPQIPRLLHDVLALQKAQLLAPTFQAVIPVSRRWPYVLLGSVMTLAALAGGYFLRIL